MDFSADAGNRLINGRYRLVEVIGRGGMGTVWRGHDEMLDRDVAVKEIHLPPDIEGAERAEIVELAMREARATARLNHPGIVTIFDVLDDDGIPIIVMELLDGRSLADILREQVRLPYRRVAEIGAAVLDALREAHAAGIIHRDLKPGNVLLTEQRVMITDFGVARRAGERADDVEDVLGTPAFMAPEQVENAAAGPAADMWSLGATLFNAVEGKPPFQGPDYATVLLTMLTQDAPAPAHAGPLAPLITELLRKDPDHRPTAEDATERLATILTPDGGSAPTAGPGIPAPAPGTGAPAPGTSAAAPAGARSPLRPAGRPRPARTPRPAAGAPHPMSGHGWVGKVVRRPVRRVLRLPVKPGSGIRRGATVGLVLAGVLILVSALVATVHSFAPSRPGSTQAGALDSALTMVEATAFSPDGSTVAFGGISGNVRVYDTSSHRQTQTFDAPTDLDSVIRLAFSPDGRMLAVGMQSGQVDLWDIAQHRHRRLTGFGGALEAMTFAAGGRIIVAVGGNATVGVWTVSTGAYRSSNFPTTGGFCGAAAVSPDGRYAACASNEGVTVANVGNGKRVASWPKDQPIGLAFSPDSTTLAFPAGPIGNGRPQLWDMTTHRKTGELDAKSSPSSEDLLAFSPDGTALAVPLADSNDRYPIGVWRTADGTKVGTFDPGPVAGVALSREGRMLATADGEDGGALWDVRSGKRLASWPA